MTDLFAAPPPETPRTASATRAPIFGSHEWTFCPCGRFASLHFPNAGGIRRCHACATAEGRMKGPSDA